LRPKRNASQLGLNEEGALAASDCRTVSHRTANDNAIFAVRHLPEAIKDWHAIVLNARLQD
jgi:hypothetical protein